jgi:hypothetical protein
MGIDITCGSKCISMNYSGYNRTLLDYLNQMYEYLKQFNDVKLIKLFRYYEENILNTGSLLNNFHVFYNMFKDILTHYKLDDINILIDYSGYNSRKDFSYILPSDAKKLIRVFKIINNIKLNDEDLIEHIDSEINIAKMIKDHNKNIIKFDDDSDNDNDNDNDDSDSDSDNDSDDDNSEFDGDFFDPSDEEDDGIDYEDERFLFLLICKYSVRKDKPILFS